MALLEWLQATHPEPKVSAALKDPTYRLVTTTPRRSRRGATRGIRPAWWPTTRVARRLLADAQAELDRQIGLSRVKEQIETLPRRNADGKGPSGPRHEGRPDVKAHDLCGPARYRQDHDCPGGGEHPRGPRRDRRTETRRDVPQGFRRRVRRPVSGQDVPHHRQGRRRRAVHRRGLHAGAGARRPRRPVRHRGA